MYHASPLSTLLPHLGLLSHPLGLILLRGVDFACIHHLFAFELPLPLQVSKSMQKGKGRRGSERLSLGCLPKCVPLRLGLYQIQPTEFWFALNPHLVKYWWEWWVEIRNWNFWGQSLVENFKLVIGIRYFNHFFFYVSGVRRGGYSSWLL